MTQQIDYNNITNRIVDILSSHNTATSSYDLSLGLTRRIQYINRDDLFIRPEFRAKYPLIAVSLESKREAIVDYNGNRRGREIEFIFRIICVSEKFTNSEEEVWTAVRNIDAILREYPTLSNYEEDMKVVATFTTGGSFSIEFMGASFGNFLFKALVANEDAFTKAARTSLTVKCYLDDAEVA